MPLEHYTQHTVLQPWRRGDSWRGIVSFGPVIIDGIAPASPAASCRLHFRRKADGALGYEFNNVGGAGKGTIVIANAATWYFTLAKQALPLASGDWVWDFEVTDAAGAVLTPYDGSLEIIADVSRSA